MKKPLHKLVKQYDIPKAWLANMCGFSRPQLANWIGQPYKYPIPADKKEIVQQKLRELGKVLTDIELM